MDTILLVCCCCYINWQTASAAAAHLLVSFGGAASALSGTLWNSMSPRLAMGARVCVCEEPARQALSALFHCISFSSSALLLVEESSRPERLLCPLAICAHSNLVLHRGERQRRRRAGNGTAFTLSFAHLPVRWSITENGTAHLVFDARKRERERDSTSISVVLLLLLLLLLHRFQSPVSFLFFNDQWSCSHFLCKAPLRCTEGDTAKLH